MRLRTIVCTMAGLLTSAPILAQEAQRDSVSACPAQASAPSDSSGIPVVIVARVHADALVFETDPAVSVTLNGCEPLPGHVLTTSNLPETIVPGVRYTDVEITTEYRAVLTIECRAPGDVAARLCEELRGRE